MTELGGHALYLNMQTGFFSMGGILPGILAVMGVWRSRRMKVIWLGWVAWGVFGTNLNKNFRVENCRLNRIDVHFHCWNLYIRDCDIGFKGISVTGGGNLFVDNTTRHGNSFISFRRDYGAKWDGGIRLRGCTLRPTSNGTVSVLSQMGHDCAWAGTLGGDAQGELVLADLERHQVDTGACVRLGRAGTPTSYVTLSRATGSRTIVHHRDLPEL